MQSLGDLVLDVKAILLEVGCVDVFSRRRRRDGWRGRRRGRDGARLRDRRHDGENADNDDRDYERAGTYIIKRILLLIIYRAPYFKKVSYSQHSRSPPGYSRGCAAQGMDGVLWDNALCALSHSTPSRGRAPQALARGGVP